MGVGLGLGLELSAVRLARDVHERHEAVVDPAVRVCRGPLQVLYVAVHMPPLRRRAWFGLGLGLGLGFGFGLGLGLGFGFG